MSAFRTSAGGRIDRTRGLTFTFDGRIYHGLHGDTLASALIANGGLYASLWKHQAEEPDSVAAE